MKVNKMLKIRDLDYKFPYYPNWMELEKIENYYVQQLYEELQPGNNEEIAFSEVTASFFNLFNNKLKTIYGLYLLCIPSGFEPVSKLIDYWGAWKKKKKDFFWIANLKNKAEVKIVRGGDVRFVGLANIPEEEYTNVFTATKKHRYFVIVLMKKTINNENLLCQNILPVLSKMPDNEIGYELPCLVSIICGMGGGVVLPYGSTDFGGVFIDLFASSNSDIFNLLNGAV